MVGMVSARKVAIPPTMKIETRITHSISVSEALKRLKVSNHFSGLGSLYIQA